MDSSVWDFLRQVSEQGDIYRQRPDVGRIVKVIKGRKHLGDVGIVKWHGRDKYDTNSRYRTDAQECLHEMIGRLGFRIKIDTESGDSFFISADYVEVI